MFVFALLLAGLIASGLFPGSGDPTGERYSGADGKRLLAAGTLQSKEITANGFRLILDHVSFAPGSSKTSSAAKAMIRELNAALSSNDRVQVFLSDGRDANTSLYGEAEEESSLWKNFSAPEDQSDLFEAVRVGDKVTLYGTCSQSERATNPGQFDNRRYCLARRIVLKMRGVTLRERRRPNGIQAIWAEYRNQVCDQRIRLQKGLLDLFGPEDASQAAAFVLGDSSGVDLGTKSLFRNGGLSWLVCVSSLHISLLGMMLYRFLRARGIPFLPVSLIVFFVVFQYAILTGFSLSAQRALITTGIWLGAQIFGRTKDTLSALSAASIFILLRQPFALRDSSFVIAMVCILSIEYLTPILMRILRCRKAVQKKLCSALALWIGSLPVVLWFFYQTSPYAAVLYPVMLPLMSLFLGFGILSALAGGLYVQTSFSVILTVGRILAWPCRFLLSFVRFLCTVEQKLPMSVMVLGRPALWQVLLYYGILTLLILLIRRRKKGILSFRRMRLLAAGTLGSIVLMVCLRKHPDFRFTCLDIGQGSCNLVEYKGRACLFDAGSSSVGHVWQYRIDSTLKYYGIRKLDLVFLSHADLDHINGVEQMLGQYHTNLLGQNAQDVTIGRILVPDLPAPDDRMQSILLLAQRHGIETGCVSNHTCLKQEDLTLQILSPSTERITGNANEDCIVMLLTFRDLRILFTGDLEKEGEAQFVKAFSKTGLFADDPMDSDPFMVLIAGHHGSQYATSEEFLDLVKPDLVLISCGRNNRYGHPSEKMLKRLRQEGIPYRRTDLEGAMQMIQ